MGHNVVEDENHVLFDCDLYANSRSKLITTLNKLPHSTDIENYLHLNVSQESLKRNLMNILSPFTKQQELTEDNINQFNQHHFDHNLKPYNTPGYASLLHIRTYIINSVCTYIYRCLDKRCKYLKEVREAEDFRSIVIFLDV